MKHYFVLGMIFLLLLFTRIGQAQERLDLSAQIPIVAWYGIRANEATVERFKELKEAGFTINFSEYSSLEEVEKALDAAHKVGVQLIIACPELRKEQKKLFGNLWNIRRLQVIFYGMSLLLQILQC